MSTSDDDSIIDGSVVEDEDSALPAVPTADLSLPPAPVGDYTEGGVPTFDFVRDQIESRFATSLGANELAGATPEANTVDEQFAKREQAGRDRLEEIRRSMRGE